MKIFNVSQIRALDAHTIAHEPITSLDLMERAAKAFVCWYCARFDHQQTVRIFCGKGNNGGDGLAIARLLHHKEYLVQVYVVDYTEQASDDFRANLERMPQGAPLHFIKKQDELPAPAPGTILIDALLGSGLSRPVEGLLAAVIRAINQSEATVLSVDIASGLYADQPNGPEDVIVQPDYTVTFQLPKLAFMLPQNNRFIGDWQVVDIGLSADFIEQESTPYYFTDAAVARALIRPRLKFSHKGTFGHALLIAGSYGKMGAALLAGSACLRSGVGLLTAHVPRCGYSIVQTYMPEAMTQVDPHEEIITALPALEPYSVVGMGPGLGKDPQTLRVLEALIAQAQVPLVLDADALNLLAENPALLQKLPQGTILTPHPKEFQRLAGDAAHDYERLALARRFARKYQVVLCLKGGHTAVVFPDGTVHFNATGNAGMATGGTGDVLTGVLTALLAQKYPAEQAAQLGVYQHGAAGDRAAEQRTQTALIASDVVENLGW
ncbi:bifunctional ADP-dependent NAD(P)H-hydrate dehydratase/NAD(P)H-hydrate epimerase [Rhabdobacter roseus]|uniref:Bifunctional NAD(P)H-hydrate repair enzyme n=1 Tax=Rhabdobacter roseus TaxID=1655419 RepID=A0A840TV60_9BACT|nr:NAD(P)H-hydrate dehydratase [Rhabdobacter roseus]MBB5283978.1 NAD(P)H-hydrate epimerase [Rhabdobacter roseus]